MGKADTITRQYMNDSTIFADAFNFWVYNGRQVIQPEQLQPLDTTAVETLFTSDGKNVPIQKIRDTLKYLTVMTDDAAAYAVLGIENQTDIHYAMPVRTMLYDALEYTGQIQRIAAKHKQYREFGTTNGEYLSGFYKNDRLLPVITLVIYFGPDEWDAPVSLHEMMQTDNRELLQQVENYKIRLIAPQQLTSEDFQKFQTTLGPVLQFIKHSKEKEKLELLLQDETFQKIDYTAAMAINSCTHAKFTFEKSEGVVNMCKALDDIREECREEGRTSARIEERKKFAVNLLQSNMPVEFVAKMIPDFPLETILQLKQELQNV